MLGFLFFSSSVLIFFPFYPSSIYYVELWTTVNTSLKQILYSENYQSSLRVVIFGGNQLTLVFGISIGSTVRTSIDIFPNHNIFVLPGNVFGFVCYYHVQLPLNKYIHVIVNVYYHMH